VPGLQQPLPSLFGQPLVHGRWFDLSSQPFISVKAILAPPWILAVSDGLSSLSVSRFSVSFFMAMSPDVVENLVGASFQDAAIQPATLHSKHSHRAGNLLVFAPVPTGRALRARTRPHNTYHLSHAHAWIGSIPTPTSCDAAPPLLKCVRETGMEHIPHFTRQSR
jgi:hypothetical protein